MEAGDDRGVGGKQHGAAERTPRASADERRRALTAAAFALIAEKGLGGLRIRDVADRVGVNNATLHYYFPTKDLLIQAVIEQVGHAFVTTHAPDTNGAEAEPTAQQRLQHYFRDLRYQLRTEPERFLVVSELFVEQQRRRVMAQLYNEDTEWMAYLTAILRDGVRSGELRANLNVDTLARTIIVFCKGLPFLATASFAAVEQSVDTFEQWLLAAIRV